jgi:hypothetical protein
MAGQSSSVTVHPTGGVRALIIVARDQPNLWHFLQARFATNGDVEILLDRRLWKRRQRVQSRDLERRDVDRRRQLSSEHDLRRRSCLIVPLFRAATQQPTRPWLGSAGSAGIE